ncbi:Uncharacterized protein FWK35_00019699 [Aphis craccivora]|uniref:Uncharacterized protein n=1 Tax=Aphis craccivora TaxID=307492 RepID=A0A6G0YJR3_APHCR|nr:Uncharacterized protein FWK35_00019699 [Aphis craccivora]
MIITSRNNASISNFGGGFRCKSQYPWCVIEVLYELSVYSSNFYEICRKRENLQILENFTIPHNSNIDKNSSKS